MRTLHIARTAKTRFATSGCIALATGAAALTMTVPAAQAAPTAAAPAQAGASGVVSAASVPKTYCKKRSYKSVVRKYARGSARLPLRCGTASWGFNHVTHRWNTAYDKMIALTIARGERVKDLQQDGGTAIYALFNKKCTELFRVIYNGGALHGNGIRPQGIITAYYRVPGNARRPGGGYRTDCPVYQDI